MPKPPPIEYFEITLKCPKDMLGEVVSDFNKRGLTEVNFNLVTAVKTFRDNGPRPEVSTADFITAWTQEHPTFKANELVKVFVADGRTNSACYAGLGALVEKGFLKKLSPGEYSRADVKALPPPKKTKTVKVTKKPKVVHDVSAADFTMRVISRSHGRISSATLKRLFEKDNRAPTGVSPVLRRLVADKKIRRVGEGMYEIAKKAAPKNTEPQTNGVTAIATEA